MDEQGVVVFEEVVIAQAYLVRNEETGELEEAPFRGWSSEFAPGEVLGEYQGLERTTGCFLAVPEDGGPVLRVPTDLATIIRP